MERFNDDVVDTYTYVYIYIYIYINIYVGRDTLSFDKANYLKAII
jgi:hypothetical protein